MMCNAVGHIPVLCLLCDSGDDSGGSAICGAQVCAHSRLPLPCQEALVLDEVMHALLPFLTPLPV